MFTALYMKGEFSIGDLILAAYQDTLLFTNGAQNQTKPRLKDTDPLSFML